LGKNTGVFVSAAFVVAGAAFTAFGNPGVGVPLLLSGLGAAANVAFAPRPIGQGSFDSSPTYGSHGLTNATVEGTPKRIVLGKVRTAPAYISAFTEQIAAKQKLKAALFVADGGPNGIEAIEEVRINDEPVEKFEGVTIYKTLGTSTQEAPRGFEKVSIPYPQSVGPLGSSETFVYTTKRAVDEIAILLAFQQGLYSMKKNGGTDWETWFGKVEIQVAGEETWRPVTPSDKSMGDTWTPSSHNKSGRKVDGKDGFWTCSEKTAGVYHNLIRITLRGDDRDVDFRLDEPTVVTVRITSYASNEAGRTPRICEPTVVQVEEIVSDARDYAGAAILYVEAVASDQITGLLKIDCLVSGWKIEDPRTSTVAWTRNPAVQLHGLLLEADVGLGDWIDATEVDSTSIEDGADVCDTLASSDPTSEHYEPQFECDLVIDTFRPAIDWISEILGTMRAELIEWNGKLYLVQDVAGSSVRDFDARVERDASKRPILLAGDGDDAVPDLVERRIPFEERPNLVRVAFYDRDDEYRLTLTDTEGSAGSYEPNEVEIRRLGITRATQAAREAEHLERHFRLRGILYEFGVGLGDLDLLRGDVVTLFGDYPTALATGVDVQVLATEIDGNRGRIRALIVDAGTHAATTAVPAKLAKSLSSSTPVVRTTKPPPPAQNVNALYSIGT
jgi:predicted phage tail protein